MTECPECGKVLRGNKCACGYKLNIENHTEKKKSAYESLRCHWNSTKGRCQLIGTVGGRGRFYCPWHHECLKSDTPAENREEFMTYHRWQEGDQFDQQKAEKIFNLSLGI